MSKKGKLKLVLHHPGLITPDGRHNCYKTLVLEKETRELADVMIPPDVLVQVHPGAYEAAPLRALIDYAYSHWEEFSVWCLLNGFRCREIIPELEEEDD